MPRIGKGLLWHVGNGSAIRIGADPVVGMGSSFILPRDLRIYLEDYGIVSLAQARNHTSSATRYWFTADELDLGGEWKILWENYIRGLEFGRIRLSDLCDSLLWSQNNYVGPLTAEKGYDCILSVSCSDFHELVLAFLWNQNIPLKIACFTWLMARGRILTWDQLQSRGFHGPSRCVLCERNEEDNYHLFLACPFYVRILAYFEAKFGLSLPSFSSVSSFLAQWFSSLARTASFRYLSLFICWGL